MNNIDVAQKLAEITGKPVSSFVEAAPIEEEVAVKETKAQLATDDETDIVKKYQGEMVGKYLMYTKKQMSRKEYLSLTKKITQETLFDNPLLYVMFRSEDQVEMNFVHWCSSFKKEKNEQSE